jgi:hypothetical protein
MYKRIDSKIPFLNFGTLSRKPISRTHPNLQFSSDTPPAQTLSAEHGDPAMIHNGRRTKIAIRSCSVGFLTRKFYDWLFRKHLFFERHLRRAQPLIRLNLRESSQGGFWNGCPVTTLNQDLRARCVCKELTLSCSGWQVRPDRPRDKEWRLDIRIWRGGHGQSCFDRPATA